MDIAWREVQIAVSETNALTSHAFALVNHGKTMTIWDTHTQKTFPNTQSGWREALAYLKQERDAILCLREDRNEEEGHFEQGAGDARAAVEEVRGSGIAKDVALHHFLSAGIQSAIDAARNSYEDVGPEVLEDYALGWLSALVHMKLFEQ